MTQSVRLKLINNLKVATNEAFKGATDFTYYNDVLAKLPPEVASSVSYQDVLKKLKGKEDAFRHLIEDAEDAKTVIFPAGQASVFLDAMKKVDFDLDYTLPFSRVFLQFSEPIVALAKDGESFDIGALMLEQGEVWSDGFIQNIAYVISKDLFSFHAIRWCDPRGSDISWLGKDGIISYDDFVHGQEIEGFSSVAGLTIREIKSLAIASIGYINCENVYLHREVTPEVVNAKRERKGKSRLEPYYVCRIRGVQYDSAGNPTGEGAKHGIRYDVRGHFRRMTDGKTTWVRPHQRGLANELYVPKTYVVDKKQPKENI